MCKNQTRCVPHVGGRINVRALRRGLGAPRGFTLVEVLIVLTIMASMAGIIGVYASKYMVESRISEAEIEVGNLASMVEQHRLMARPPELPGALDELAQGDPPTTRRIPDDPWGRPYMYKPDGRGDFAVWSVGPDGQDGTEDDIRANE